MCSRNVSYVAHPNWQLGFSVIYLEPNSGRFQWYPVLISNQSFVWKDREYTVGGLRRVRKNIKKRGLKLNQGIKIKNSL